MKKAGEPGGSPASLLFLQRRTRKKSKI